MTINDMLNEVNVEFGNGQSLAVSDAIKQRTSYNKIGEKDEAYVKTADLTTLRTNARNSVANVVDYLKKKGVWNKVAAKQNFRTTDLVFKADGSCQVNYDEGGGILIPKEIVNASTPVAQKTFSQKFRERIQASAITEEVLEEDAKTIWEYKLKPILVGSTLMATAITGVGLSVKSFFNSVKKTADAIKSISRNGDVYSANVLGNDIKYDEKNNILTVNNETEKVVAENYFPY